jgi:Tfp pilus assembly protein PilZ
MTAAKQPYTTVPRIFELIHDLSPDQQFGLLKQLLKDNVTIQLFKLVVSLPEDQQKTLLKHLEELISQKGDRRDSRKPCLITVNYAVDGRAFTNYIQDISPTGVFIESGESFAVGQNILMTFSFPDMEDSFRIGGEISRTTPKGFGVKFNYKSQLQKDVIQDIVKKMKQA